MLPRCVKNRVGFLSFPRRRESSGKPFSLMTEFTAYLSGCDLPEARAGSMGWIPACAGMTRIIKLTLAASISGILLAGCAGTPAVNKVIPASDTQQKPAAPVKDAEGKHQYVLALMNDENWQEAATELEILTAARPGLAAPWVNLGIVHTMLGDSTAAESAFKRALDANDDSAEAWNQLGMLYRRSGQLDEARNAYNSGLQSSPDHAELHWNLAILHDRYLPDPVIALAHYERYQQLTKSDDPQLTQWIASLREQVPKAEPAKMTAEAKK